MTDQRYVCVDEFLHCLPQELYIQEEERSPADQLPVKYDKPPPRIPHPRMESTDMTNALKNWTQKMRDRKRQQGYLSSEWARVIRMREETARLSLPWMGYGCQDGGERPGIHIQWVGYSCQDGGKRQQGYLYSEWAMVVRIVKRDSRDTSPVSGPRLSG